MSEGKWPIVSLGELIASIEAGSSFRCRETPPEADEVGVAKVSAVSWGHYDETESKTCLDPSRIDERLLIQKGDFLISRANTVQLVGACVIAERVSKRVMLSDKTLRIRFKDPSFKPWVLHFLRSREGRNQIEALCTGNQESMRNISQKSLKQIELPLAPAEERVRILADLDLQLNRLHAATATFSHIQAKLKQARASILKAAVEGRLVETEAECLSAQRPHYAQVQVLVNKLEDERQSRSIKGNKKGHGTAKTDSLNPEIEGRFLVPNGWTRVAVNELCWDSGYGTSFKCYPKSDGDPVLRIPNVAKGKLDLTDLKKTAQRGALADDEMIAPGDFLFVRTNGSMSILGKGCAIVSEPTFPMSYASYLIRLRLLGPNAIWKWFELVWNSSLFRRKIEASAASSAGQNNISLSKVLSFELPLPPEQEIHQILELVDQRFSVLDQVEATVQASLARCGVLRQAILKRAFEGRLVPAT